MEKIRLKPQKSIDQKKEEKIMSNCPHGRTPSPPPTPFLILLPQFPPLTTPPLPLLQKNKNKFMFYI